MVYYLYSKSSILEFEKFSINGVFQFFLLEYVLQRIVIDERVLMIWRKYSDRVLGVLIENTNMLYEGDGNAILRLRRRFYAYGLFATRCARIYNKRMIKIK
jgi:hypothetical protein